MWWCALLVVGCLAGTPDWLVTSITTPVTLTTSTVRLNGATTPSLVLSNGLVSRTFITNPGFGTVDFRSLSSSTSILRSVNSEALIQLDGVEYPIGGLTQAHHVGYLNRTDKVITLNPKPHWTYISHNTSAPEAPYPWTPGLRHSPKNVNWPPKGLHLTINFVPPKSAPPEHQKAKLQIHYEMYVGIPLVVKYLTMQGDPSSPNVVLEKAVVELLGVNRPYSPMVFDAQIGLSWFTGPRFGGDESSKMWVQTNYPHATSVEWQVDPLAGGKDQPGASEPLLNASYSGYIGLHLSTEPFLSFHVFELVTDTTDPERSGLSRRRLTRLLAPATMENPIFMHLTDASSAGIRKAADQCAEVGFEMIILSFGTSFNLESQSEEYIARMASDIAYARSKGIEVGGYDLICWTRNVGSKWDRVNPETGHTDNNACFASGWVEHLTEVAMNFINKTGLSMVETDGPYPGYPCASKNHAHHAGLEDSVYQQTLRQAAFFKRLRSLDIFINQPDTYFWQGGSKTGMGYAEVQYNLPRWQDLSVSRAGMYDDTFKFTPTQGWMFVPLIEYHGGGAAATFEPLSEHLPEYGWALAQYLGAGVAACYRGPRLYDTNATKAVVKHWVDFYKSYRDILISDIIHVRRPDMQGIDAFMHANPTLKHRGLAMVFNPTTWTIKESLVLPLYYTGLTDSAVISKEGINPTTVHLARDYSVEVDVNLPPMSLTWYLIESP